MQLKLRVGVGESLTIDVQPTDTFQDLSDKLYQLAGVQVDLSQLKSNDKPFDMTTNVIHYFTLKSEKASDSEEDVKMPKLCRLCSESISHDPQFLFEPREEEQTLAEKVNTALPIHVTVRDKLPKQICTSCLNCLNNSYNFVVKVLQAQKSLENVYSVKDNYPNEDCCPLCMVGRLKTLDPKGKACNQSRKENIVKKEVVITVPRTGVAIKKEPEYYLDDEIVTEYWDGSIPSNLDAISFKKLRKRPKIEDDADWTIDEEYVPVSRRGRPKGTKNKPKIIHPIVEKSCVLCGWLGADTDIFAHAINQHCQPDMNYFPCPLCRVKQVNENVLENHINRHNQQNNCKAGTST